MEMKSSAPIAGATRNPWNLPPGALAAQQTSGPRPTWQVTRWPVSRDEYERLVEAARAPDMFALEAVAAVIDAQAPAAPGPVLVDNFDAIGATALEPPDPALAAGPNDVMTAVNAEFAVAPKTRPLPGSLPFSALFGAAMPPGATSVFDPKLAYDHFAQRWIVIVVAKRESPPGSWIMLGASQTPNPRGAYYTWALDAALDGDTPTQNWADYPTLGFDEQAIYIGLNMFRFGGGFQYAKLRILNKSEVFAPPGAATPVLRWHDIVQLANPDGSPAFSLQPAVHHRTAPGPAYLVNALWPGGAALTAWTLTDPLAAWQNPPGSPTLTAAAIACQSYDLPPSADQLGGSPKLNTGDSRLLNAIYHGDGAAADGLWTAHTSKFTWQGESVARSVAQWYQLDVGGSAVVQQGRYGTPGAYFFYPAMQTAQNGDAFMVFGRCSATEYGAHSAPARSATDPVNTLRSSTLVQAGASTYGGGRWGDYFSACRDPQNITDVWLCGEYSGSAGWATRVCSAKV